MLLPYIHLISVVQLSVILLDTIDPRPHEAFAMSMHFHASSKSINSFWPG